MCSENPLKITISGGTTTLEFGTPGIRPPCPPTGTPMYVEMGTLSQNIKHPETSQNILYGWNGSYDMG